MYRFLLSRAIGLVIVLLGVTFLTFIIGYFAPGDPIRVMMGIKSVAYPDVYMQLKHEYGLDLPWWQQYYNFVVNALHGNFGLSYHYQEMRVIDLLNEGLATSIELGLEVLAATVITGIP